MFSHLRDVKMTYFQHLKVSLGYSYSFMTGSIKAFIHGVFPDMYTTSTSDLIRKLHKDIESHNKID